LERASVDAIAADAGVSKMTVYNNFGSKEGLFQAFVRDRTATVVAGARAPRRWTRTQPEKGAAGNRRPVSRTGARGTTPWARALRLRRRGGAAEVACVLQGRPGACDARAGCIPARALGGTLKVRKPASAADLFLSMFLGSGHFRGLLKLEMPDSR